MKLNQKHYSLIDKALSRRSFLAGAGSVAAAGMLAGCSNNGTTTIGGGGGGGSTSYTDADILNFALNLEYLEANFYLYAATGNGLGTADTQAPTGYTGKYTAGTVKTDSTVTAVLGTSAAQKAIINEIAFEEQEHVRFLRAALAANAVPMPNLDLTFFAKLGTLLATPITGFSPFASFDAFLIGSFIFEDVGVTAYLGAAPLISAAGVTSGYLTAAAGILAVEAYHAAYVRTSLVGSAIAAGATTSLPTDLKYPYVGIANEVEAIRASLTTGASGAPTNTNNTGNTGQKDTSASVEVLLNVPQNKTTASAIVACDSARAIAFARTTDQVHHIVYGSATPVVSSGGFFPNGTNSIFSTTTA